MHLVSFHDSVHNDRIPNLIVIKNPSWVMALSSQIYVVVKIKNPSWVMALSSRIYVVVKIKNPSWVMALSSQIYVVVKIKNPSWVMALSSRIYVVVKLLSCCDHCFNQFIKTKIRVQGLSTNHCQQVTYQLFLPAGNCQVVFTCKQISCFYLQVTARLILPANRLDCLPAGIF